MVHSGSFPKFSLITGEWQSLSNIGGAYWVLSGQSLWIVGRKMERSVRKASRGDDESTGLPALASLCSFLSAGRPGADRTFQK